MNIDPPNSFIARMRACERLAEEATDPETGGSSAVGVAIGTTLKQDAGGTAARGAARGLLAGQAGA